MHPHLDLVVFLLVIGLAGCHSPVTAAQEQQSIDAVYQSPACPIPTYAALQTNAADWPCPSASVVQEIDSQVTLQFLVDETAPNLMCHAADGSADLTSLQLFAYQTLYLLKRLQFDAPLPWTSLSLWDWFTSRVHVIQFTSDGVAMCCIENKTGFIVPGGVTGPSGLVAGATFPTGFPTGVFGFVHEARHTEGYFHDCNDSIRDRNIPELGAWGVQYYLGLWIANHLTAPLLTTAERNYALQASEELRTYGAAFCTACGGI